MSLHFNLLSISCGPKDHWCKTFTPFAGGRTPNACVRYGRVKEYHENYILVDDPQNPHNQIPDFSKKENDE